MWDGGVGKKRGKLISNLKAEAGSVLRGTKQAGRGLRPRSTPYWATGRKRGTSGDM